MGYNNTQPKNILLLLLDIVNDDVFAVVFTTILVTAMFFHITP